ncbi:MAG: inorganic phosphate transporter [Breznakibacter sp.]
MAITLLVVLLLVVLGIIDLIVGVSNNAVNFLNSAVGAKVASRRVILWVAALGLIAGSFFSSGMMDLARSGVINPQSFSYRDLMAVFAAVMIVHVLLIDAMNAYALPTSTTTALIFQLLGGALAVAFIKSYRQETVYVSGYIDTNQVFLMMSGIFLSVFIAFLLGLLVQFASRMIFTFNYRGRFAWLFSLSGALAVSVIFYFILKKGLYTDMFDLGGWYHGLDDRLVQVLGCVFVLSFFVFFVATKLFHIDVPRWVVFFGTFALAMSFTSNDLVNFIGIPLAAAESTWYFLASGQDASSYTLDLLKGELSHPFARGTYILLFFVSAVIMAITIFYSRKSRAVIDTEILLERQGAGDERFEPTPLSRSVVRQAINLSHAVAKLLPVSLTNFMARRFDRTVLPEPSPKEEIASFDMVRASVNLIVASVMILMATWSQIPLSTTFVVFMVSMGTSLADKAWGRDNAVYRLSGVFTILGSWFLVSCLALAGAFVLTFVLWYGGIVALLVLLVLTFVVLYRNNSLFARKMETLATKKTNKTEMIEPEGEWFYEQGNEYFRRHLLEASKIYFLSLRGFIDEDTDTLRQAKNKASDLGKQTKDARHEFFRNLKTISDRSLESGHHFMQALDYISELANSLHFLCDANYIHIHNQHKGLGGAQRRELDHLLDEVSNYFNLLVHIEKEQRFSILDESVAKQHLLIEYMDELRKNQIKRIRGGESKTRVSVLYMDLLSETKNILLYAINVVKSHRDYLKAL